MAWLKNLSVDGHLFHARARFHSFGDSLIFWVRENNRRSYYPTTLNLPAPGVVTLLIAALAGIETRQTQPNDSIDRNANSSRFVILCSSKCWRSKDPLGGKIIPSSTKNSTRLWWKELLFCWKYRSLRRTTKNLKLCCYAFSIYARTELVVKYWNTILTPQPFTRETNSWNRTWINSLFLIYRRNKNTRAV